ncbi:nicotinate-nucleotide adenylyltransferase [Thalassotalea sp. LPB0316]|uniref:nicotinate-nucleotide adenylyltransferase n=1 Tax=Thalassotalea sp. LPB0316 TaxID=2769490 RepID=UPI0018661115|nr:nicotinate-nucleotide adenylyltransferase [Thalassotalea sp. LPB0316]QOL24461.1 nicotinate-nucleotide adenylyltransferase [Thalassotalea sp. LPB0316]
MTKKLQRIGLFGGTFNPIHLGHIDTVEQGAKLLALDKVALMPANIPPHKDKPTIANHHRVNMLNLVCQDNPRFYLEPYELEQTETSYTVNTLKAFKQHQPNQRLYFFIGMDSLVNFHLWRDYQEILAMTNLIVSTRPGYQLSQVIDELKPRLISYQAYLANHQHETGHIILLPEVNLAIASSDIRRLVEQNKSINSLVPPSIEQYIDTHKLYQQN